VLKTMWMALKTRAFTNRSFLRATFYGSRPTVVSRLKSLGLTSEFLSTVTLPGLRKPCKLGSLHRGLTCYRA